MMDIQHMPEREIVLEIRDLQKSFGDNHVLKNFNLKLHQGETW